MAESESDSIPSLSLESFDESWKVLRSQLGALIAEIDNLRQQKHDFEKEKNNYFAETEEREDDLMRAAVQAAEDIFDTVSGDILDINVGGEKFTTLRSTLVSVPDSLLASLFLGNNDIPLVRDEEGIVFIDRDPKLFRMILNGLRTGTWLVPSRPDECAALAVELDYFGLVPLQYSDQLPGNIYVIGGTDGDQALSTVEMYDSEISEWIEMPSLSSPRYGHCAVVLQNEIYVIGGWNDEYGVLTTVEKYSPIDKQWHKVTPLTTGRSDFAAIVFDLSIFVFGGMDFESNRLSSVERFDIETEEWTSMIPPMSTSRSWFAAVLLDEQIYALGGRNDAGTLRTVETFDPRTYKWSPVPSMKARRFGLEAVVCDEKIYALGGRGAKTVEVFDPVHQEWAPNPPMLGNRFHLAAVACEGKIYAFGGRDGTKHINTAEIFDPNVQTWTSFTPMNVSRSLCSAVVCSIQQE